MNESFEKLNKEIIFICSRPGMYTGDMSLNSLQIYIQGLLHGMDVCGYCSFDDWRQWIYKIYSPSKENSWVFVLLQEFKTEEVVIANMPQLMSKFLKEYAGNV